MTILEAFEELLTSEEYKRLAVGTGSKAGKYRLYISRHKKNSLGVGAMVELLIAHDYTITANKTVKKLPKKKK
jgi:hypothetical protein